MTTTDPRTGAPADAPADVPTTEIMPAPPPRQLPPPRILYPDPPEMPRNLHSRTLDDKASMIGAGIGSLGLAWLIAERIVPVHGLLGFIPLWFVLYLFLYGCVSAVGNDRVFVMDRLVSAAVHAGAFLVGLILLGAVVFVFVKGAPALRHLNFYTDTMSGVRPQDPLNHGGIRHAVVGSLIEVGIAIAITLPLGVGAAVYMTEVGGRLARMVRTVVEAMTALPSIVAGLFIYTVLIVYTGFPRSGLAAALAISVMMLPIIARAADVVLRVVPGGLREAGYALGATQWRVVWHVVLPTARPGLATALILGIARGVGETSPVLLTSGAAVFQVIDPTAGDMNSLPLFIYFAVRSGVPNYVTRGYGAAAVLLFVVLALFIIARRIARQRGGRP